MILLLFLQIEWQTISRPYNDSLQELFFHFTIPRMELKYILEDSTFYASYETQLTVYDERGNQLAGDYWRVKITEDSLDIRDSIGLVIPNMSSYFNLRIIDLHSGEIFNISEKIIPINYLGNIKWLLKEDTLFLNFTVFNESGSVDSIFSTIEGIEKILQLKAGIYEESLTFLVKELPNDDYELKFEIFYKDRNIDEVEVPIKISRPFYLDDSVWFLKIDQLQYIATPSEMGKLRKAEKTERDSLWYSFWSQYDPTPNTEFNEKEKEYFARIEYCDKRFIHGDRGWRSDRAKIYVKYGPPDEIQSHPYEIHSRPYEIWLYYRYNRKYIFVDQYGFGEYIILNPQGTSI